jgi:hypothetical protein
MAANPSSDPREEFCWDMRASGVPQRVHTVHGLTWWNATPHLYLPDPLLQPVSRASVSPSASCQRAFCTSKRCSFCTIKAMLPCSSDLSSVHLTAVLWWPLTATGQSQSRLMRVQIYHPDHPDWRGRRIRRSSMAQTPASKSLIESWLST